MLLPAQTRYEMAGGVTETSTERRVIFSPEVRRAPGARGPAGVGGFHWSIAQRARPRYSCAAWSISPARPRSGRRYPGWSRVRPDRLLRRQGDQFQYGGPMLCEGGRFPTADGKAHFSVVALPPGQSPRGPSWSPPGGGASSTAWFRASGTATRGPTATPCSSMPSDAADAGGLADGAALVLRSDSGLMDGACPVAPVTRGTLQVHWPEGEACWTGRRGTGARASPITPPWCGWRLASPRRRGAGARACEHSGASARPGPTSTTWAWEVLAGRGAAGDDQLATEEPLEIRLLARRRPLPRGGHHADPGGGFRTGRRLPVQRGHPARPGSSCAGSSYCVDSGRRPKNSATTSSTSR